ncbi:Uncharacterized protein TCM_034460 [Theobroma cacao]|uniref:Rhodanese domain-containing protein n=1 Tax=Theobroma cacao TaxID=3641 RepID=A0A061FE89_THECC|nr:Uncharacterized protein TCM_034460 [Theobroma cacao]
MFNRNPCKKKKKQIKASENQRKPIKKQSRNIGILLKEMASEAEIVRKPRFLCLHGFRTRGAILKKQIETNWPQSVLEKIDLVYPDAPFPAQGKADVEGIFDPPYYEWFQFNKEFTSYTNFEECLAYIEDIMIKQGPFDGLLGFSQGAILSGGLPGLQAKGLALTKVPKIKYLIIIGGAKFKSESVAEKARDRFLKTKWIGAVGILCRPRCHSSSTGPHYSQI